MHDSVNAEYTSISGHVIIGTFSLHRPDSCSGLCVVGCDDSSLRAEPGSEQELVDSITDVHVMHNCEIRHPRESGDPGKPHVRITLKMDSRFRGNDVDFVNE